jgi:large subunit ribosomal protein L29
MATKPLKPAELRQMSPEQLALTLKDTVKQLFTLRVQATTERVETPSEMRKLRRDIARIKTIMRERELKQERLSGKP